jgi:phospholipid/cholesterol/gamma-HCH transport system substrate-binding protein
MALDQNLLNRSCAALPHAMWAGLAKPLAAPALTPRWAFEFGVVTNSADHELASRWWKHNLKRALVDAVKGSAMNRNLLETLLGAIVLIVAVGFLGFAYRSSQVSSDGGYELVAHFDRVDGLDQGADVRISGIKVGSVIDQQLNAETFRAEIRFTMRDDVELPSDTSAAVVSDGLLGGKYLALVPGGDIEMLEPGDEVSLTQSAINLEDLIGHMIFSQGEK